MNRTITAGLIVTALMNAFGGSSASNPEPPNALTPSRAGDGVGVATPKPNPYAFQPKRSKRQRKLDAKKGRTS